MRTEEVPVVFDVPDADGYLRFVVDAAGPLAMALCHLSDAERDEIKEDLEESLTPFAAEDGYHLPGRVLCAVGS